MSELKQTDLSKRLRAKANQPFGPEDFMLLTQAADEIERYYTGMLNWKATAEAQSAQPEATKPAQDLSAAILALPLPTPTILDTGSLTSWEAEVFARGALAMRKAAAALSSPADALVAGDSETAKDAERYRFLRDHGVPETDAEIEKALTVYQGVGLNSLLPDELDSAIDAAIQAQKDGHG